MSAEITQDAMPQALRKMAQDLRDEAQRLRDSDAMPRQASFTVDAEALRRLIHA